jgi:hypothetical protein
MGAVRGGRDGLFRLAGIAPPDLGGVADVQARPRARHGDHPLVLPAQQCLQAGRHGLPRLGRHVRPGQPSRRHHRGGHHQAEDGGEQRRLQCAEVQQDQLQGVLGTHHRPPDRPGALPGRLLLHGPRRHDQFRRRIEGRRRSRPGRAHGGDQQARRRHGPDLRPQGLPEADEGRHRTAQRHPGRVSLEGRDHRLT